MSVKTHPSLKAMAEDKSLDNVSKVTSFAVDPRILEVEEGFNGRPINWDHVRAIADSYKAGATFPDLEVRVEEGRVIVVDGHHRREGALLAISEGAEIKAVGAKHFRGNDADRVMLMITSQQGLPMTPLQLGVQYKKMRDVFGWEVKAIAARIGKSAQHIKDCIALAEANTDVQKLVNAGHVPATVALKTVRAHGSKAGAVLADDLAKARAAGKEKVTAKTASTRPAKDLLAAAAPDLLEALKAIMAEVDEMTARTGWAGSGGREKARAAIAKATGSTS